jgi:hypothetical protein
MLCECHVGATPRDGRRGADFRRAGELAHWHPGPGCFSCRRGLRGNGRPPQPPRRQRHLHRHSGLRPRRSGASGQLPPVARPRSQGDRRPQGGGAYFTQHAEYYAGTLLGPWRAPDVDVKGVDVLERLIPVAKARDTRVYSFILENTHSGLTRFVPNWPKVLQVDAWGRKLTHD